MGHLWFGVAENHIAAYVLSRSPAHWRDSMKGKFTLSDQGLFLVLVGPDGAGKTSVARELILMHTGPTAYVHFRPPLLKALAESPDEPIQVSNVKPDFSGMVMLGWLRLFWSLLAFWVGYVLRIRPAIKNGSLVVADRWGYGYFAQPQGLRFYGPPRLAEWAVKRLPVPDLIANLRAEPNVIFERKRELTLDQLVVELARWRALPLRNVYEIDASGTAHDTAGVIYAVFSDDQHTL